MPRQVLLFSGASAVGKTSVLKSLLPLLAHGGVAPCVCKIDCLKTGDADVFQRLGLPCVTGLSGDICPDHFLVSNLPELWGRRRPSRRCLRISSVPWSTTCARRMRPKPRRSMPWLPESWITRRWPLWRPRRRSCPSRFWCRCATRRWMLIVN